LKHAYYIKCEHIVKDDKSGEILEVHCSYDPETKGGWSKDGRRVMGTLHWVSAPHAVEAEVRLYDHLFTVENPNEVEAGTDFKDYLNPESLLALTSCKVESSLQSASPGERCQFLRQGYFCVDRDSNQRKLIFNRTVSLRDTWAKIEKTIQKK
jgi:glutaminyl-tRNA synthetase